MQQCIVNEIYHLQSWGNGWSVQSWLIFALKLSKSWAGAYRRTFASPTPTGTVDTGRSWDWTDFEEFSKFRDLDTDLQLLAALVEQHQYPSAPKSVLGMIWEVIKFSKEHIGSLKEITGNSTKKQQNEKKHNPPERQRLSWSDAGRGSLIAWTKIRHLAASAGVLSSHQSWPLE